MKSSKGAPHQPATDLVTAGRQYSEHGIVSPGVYHASTILYPNTDALRAQNQPYTCLLYTSDAADDSVYV